MTKFADLDASVDELEHHRHTLFMVPRLWKALLLPHALHWTTYPFHKDSRSRIPNQHGVYAFLITPAIAGNIHVAYLMYIGKTDRPLRQRFGEYLKEVDSDRIRPKLIRLLPRYLDHLVFACAPLPDASVPKDVEDALLEAFIPPCNDQIPATVGRARKAFT